MKAVKDMSLRELVEEVNFYSQRFPHLALVADRLYELHDLTQWIPVSERMPTEEDGYIFSDRGCVVAWDNEIGIHDTVFWFRVINEERYTHWRRITPPEGV
jgi:hypothetical protein